MAAAPVHRPVPYRRRQDAGLAAFLVVALLLEFVLMTDTVGRHLINLWLTYSIAIVGFYFVFGLGGRFAFCQTFMMMLGGYMTAWLGIHAGFWIGLLAGVAVTVVVAGALAIATIRVQEFYFAIATLAVTEIGLEVFRNWSGFAGQNGVQIDMGTPTLFGTEFITEEGFFWLLLGATVVVLLLGIAIERSPVRRHAVAARERAVAAEASGVQVRRLQIGLFVYGSVLGAFSGGLIGAWEGSLATETFGIDLAIAIFVGVIIGGVGSMWGAVAGAAFVVFLPELLTGLEQYQTIIYGAILLLGVILLPQGAAGILAGLRERYVDPRRAIADADPDPPPAEAKAVAKAKVVQHVPPTGAVAASNGHAPGVPLLRAENVIVRFGGVTAVDGVSIEVSRPGQVLGVVGPNGSGKSTFLNAISGIVPYTGTVSVRGTVVRPGHLVAARTAGLARAFQTAQNFPELTCLDNVLVGTADRRASGFAGAWLTRPRMWKLEHERWEEAARALERVGLAGMEDRPAKLLTYGQHRLLELARCLVGRPDVLVLDEPSAGLNEAETDALADLIEQLASEGLAVLLVEHKIDFVNRLCERVLVIDTGKPIAEGPPAEVWNHPRVAEAFLGSAVAHA